MQYGVSSAYHPLVTELTVFPHVLGHFALLDLLRDISTMAVRQGEALWFGLFMLSLETIASKLALLTVIFHEQGLLNRLLQSLKVFIKIYISSLLAISM